MNAEKTAIRVLAATAAILLLAIVLLPSRGTAQEAMRGGDYLVATYPAATGSDALYVADTHRGVVAVFVYDPGVRGLIPRGMRPLAEAFPPP